MSGYLRRLVTAAMHPPRAVHAAVGSVYAPHRPGAAPAEAGLSVSSETASDAPQPTNRPGARDVHRSSGSAPHDDTFEGDSTPFLVEREHEQRGLSARGADARESAARRGAAAGHDRRAERFLDFEEQHSGASALSRERAEAEPGLAESARLADMLAASTHAGREIPGELPPLIEMERSLPESSTRGASAGTIRLQSAGVPRPEPLPRAERAEEPDEIQIHIGRIEVTAVPPPAAARPVTRPERRSVNLDEYLKQRRGGNR
ncbi:MAG: hypothetical protein WA294_11635 [Acidobacteriaceae bacterium]